MREITRPVYKIDELSENSKHLAHNVYLSEYLEYFMTMEVKKSFEHFEETGKSDGLYIGEILVSGVKLDKATEIKKSEDDEESFESFVNTCEGNQWEFFKNGEMFFETLGE